jgi:hypothetical protein
MGIAAVTRADYEQQGGAWKDDHRPEPRQRYQ